MLGHESPRSRSSGLPGVCFRRFCPDLAWFAAIGPVFARQPDRGGVRCRRTARPGCRAMSGPEYPGIALQRARPHSFLAPRRRSGLVRPDWSCFRPPAGSGPDAPRTSRAHRRGRGRMAGRPANVVGIGGRSADVRRASPGAGDAAPPAGQHRTDREQTRVRLGRWPDVRPSSPGAGVSVDSLPAGDQHLAVRVPDRCAKPVER